MHPKQSVYCHWFAEIDSSSMGQVESCRKADDTIKVGLNFTSVVHNFSLCSRCMLAKILFYNKPEWNLSKF